MCRILNSNVYKRMNLTSIKRETDEEGFPPILLKENKGSKLV